jgi:hypothetical protein
MVWNHQLVYTFFWGGKTMCYKYSFQYITSLAKTQLLTSNDPAMGCLSSCQDAGRCGSHCWSSTGCWSSRCVERKELLADDTGAGCFRRQWLPEKNLWLLNTSCIIWCCIRFTGSIRLDEIISWDWGQSTNRYWNNDINQ